MGILNKTGFIFFNDDGLRHEIFVGHAHTPVRRVGCCVLCSVERVGRRVSDVGPYTQRVQGYLAYKKRPPP